MCSTRRRLLGGVAGLLAFAVTACAPGPAPDKPSSGTPDAALRRGTAAHTRGAYAEAVAAFQEAVRLDESSVAGWTGLGRAHLAGDALNPAQSAFEKAIALGSSDRGVRRDLALIAARKAGAEPGLARLEEALQEFPGDASLHKEAALMALKADRPERARFHYDKVGSVSLRSELAGLDRALKDAALQLTEDGRDVLEDSPEGARVMFEQALDLDPECATAWNEIGRSHLLEAAWGLAVEAFNNAVRLAPDVVIFRENLGFAALKADQRALAVETYREAIERDTGSLVFYEQLAELLVEDGKMTEAIAILNTGRLRLRANAGLIDRLQEIYAAVGWQYVGDDNLVGAAELFNAGLELARDDAERAAFLHGVGTVLTRQGSIDRAETALRRALALDPSHVELRLRLGDLLENLGRTWDAERIYTEGHGLDSDSVWTYRLLALEVGKRLAEGALDEASAMLEDERRNQGDTPHLAFLTGVVQFELYQQARSLAGGLSEAGSAALGRASMLMTQAASGAPASYTYRAGLAEVDAARGEVEDAIARLEEWRNKARDPVDVGLRLGRVLLEDGRNDRARAVLGECLEQAPGCGELYYALLRVHASLRDVDSAIELLRAGQSALTVAQLSDLLTREEFAKLRLNNQFEKLARLALEERGRSTEESGPVAGPFGPRVDANPSEEDPFATPGPGADPFAEGGEDPFGPGTEDPFGPDEPEDPFGQGTEDAPDDPFTPGAAPDEPEDPFGAGAPPAAPDDPFAAGEEPDDPFAAPADPFSAPADSTRPAPGPRDDP